MPGTLPGTGHGLMVDMTTSRCCLQVGLHLSLALPVPWHWNIGLENTLLAAQSWGLVTVGLASKFSLWRPLTWRASSPGLP